MTQYETWCASPALTDEERQELTAIAHDDKEIESRFWAPLSFGTAGLRGILGMGTHRMNRFVVAQTTQALANLILQNGPEALGRGVAISYDCRHHSEEFAKTCACVLAGNGTSIYSTRCGPRLSCPSPSGTMAASRASISPPATTPRNTTVTRSTGRTAPSCRRMRRTWWPRRWSGSIALPARGRCHTTGRRRRG